jgi:hypothetical protein
MYQLFPALSFSPRNLIPDRGDSSNTSQLRFCGLLLRARRSDPDRLVGAGHSCKSKFDYQIE